MAIDALLKEISSKIDSRMDRFEALQRQDHDQIVILITKTESLETKVDNLQIGFDEIKLAIPVIKEKLETACGEVDKLKTIKEEKSKSFGERVWTVAFWAVTCILGAVGAWIGTKITKET